MRRRKRRGESQPEPIAKLLEPELRKVGPPPVPLDVQRGWTDAVGEHVSDRAAPVRVQRRTLVVRVSSNAWMVELQMLAPKILARLAQVAPSSKIERVRFELGDIPRQPPPRRSAQRPNRRWRRRHGEALSGQLADAIDAIDDPDLQEHIREALERSLYE